MKKIIAGIVFGAFMLPSIAGASVCGVNGFSCGNGDPMAVTQAWGLSGHQTPVVKPGTVMYRANGAYFDTCPVWYFRGCFDLSKIIK